MLFRRRKPAAPVTVPPAPPALEQVREQIAEMIRDAEERVDGMIERLTAKAPKGTDP